MAAQWIAAMLSLVSLPALAGDMDFNYTPNPAPGEQPAFMITPSRPLQELYVYIDAGGERYEFSEEGVAAGQEQRFSWPRDPSVTAASVFVRGVFADGYVEEVQIPIQYAYGAPLAVDLSGAVADLRNHTLTVSVTSAVQRADVIAYGAGKEVLDRREVEIDAGPGEVAVPWTGDPKEVVLLDVTLHGDNAWAGFTFSPWFLDIPHDDVHFETNLAEILPEEEWKLHATLRKLDEVMGKYGELVPVKVFIAGCTDTVGDAGHNRELSLRRARAIALWLRGHGYEGPLFYFGYGEGFLAVKTGDGVDEIANRRAVYMVAANPPPASAGVPPARWIEL